MWKLQLVGQGPVVEKKAVLQALRTPSMSPNKALYEVIQSPVPVQMNSFILRQRLCIFLFDKGSLQVTRDFLLTFEVRRGMSWWRAKFQIP